MHNTPEQQRQIRNLKRQLHYRTFESDPHGNYVWATTKKISKYHYGYGKPQVRQYPLSALQQAAAENDTRRYVAAWTSLNHLVG